MIQGVLAAGGPALASSPGLVHAQLSHTECQEISVSEAPFVVTYQGLMALLEVPGVGWYAHLSGLVFGVVLAFVPRSGVKP